MTQTIYSRWEYPVPDDRTNESIFAEYEGMSIEDSNGRTIGGIQIAIRKSSPRAVIVLTYDTDADSLMASKLPNLDNIMYTDFRNNITEKIQQGIK